MEHVETFKTLQRQNEETPLDIYPELDELENWIHDAYNRLRRTCVGGEYVPLPHFKAFFDMYPIPINQFLLMDIFMEIDHEVLVFRNKLKEH